MTAERWQRIANVFEAVIDLPEEERARFLDEETSNDTALRIEVESPQLFTPLLLR